MMTIVHIVQKAFNTWTCLPSEESGSDKTLGSSLEPRDWEKANSIQLAARGSGTSGTRHSIHFKHTYDRNVHPQRSAITANK